MAVYGRVEGPEDIRRINCLIRDQMMEVQEEGQLSELKKRSDYLCTLTYSPFWQKKFGDKIEELRSVAIEENRVTVKEANIIAKFKGWDKEYSPWRSDIDIEEQLKLLPEEIVEEITHATMSLEMDTKILEQLRREFCDIRKAMVLCEDEECLKKLKRAVDILSVLPYLEEFKSHFDEGVLGAIDAFITQEKNRSVELANIICEVNGWSSYFESITDEDFGQMSAKEYLDSLLEEEEKAQTYIPTQSRYKGGGKILWLVYYHPRRKREYAKRVYLPAEYRNLKLEGPDWFKNRFGNKVWGVKISYETRIKETTIKVRGKEIHLPERWVKKEKVVTLPEIAQNVRLFEERPKSAMNIA
ncbi:hypothetical protein [Nitratiruptor sp. YY09-18]|uniref:hypothetical protein n=1 Tax=Nitratiruptor sp. YY09-18 TaxID=2724901 RepID=UPI001914E808|nr:hypothetical protein [Nitratiruptor sp. YY09-18]BCD67336.1 hypothetical protein NitYY0918_C0220 [Nitratiruptor sp. YY09-18]